MEEVAGKCPWKIEMLGSSGSRTDYWSATPHGLIVLSLSEFRKARYCLRCGSEIHITNPIDPHDQETQPPAAAP